MKTVAIIIIIILCVIQPLQSQNDSIVLNKFYHTWIVPEKGHKGKSGILYEIKDSSVMVSNSPWKQDYYNKTIDVTNLDIRNIKEIKVRRQGQGFAILAGGISGMVVGGFISSAYMDHLEKTMNPFGFVFGGFIQGIIPFIVSTGTGLGVGALLSSKISIPIRGSQSIFNMHKSKLNKYALISNSFPELVKGKSFSKFRDSVVDIDGHVYNTLALGGQVWSAENLMVTRYRDGSEVSGAADNVTGSGTRYNWFAVADSRKLCPAGWHVPSLTEWTSLFNSLGGDEGAGRRLEESFSSNGGTSQWWSSTVMDNDHAQSFYLNNTTFGVMFTGVSKSSTLSVRCIRD